MKKKALALGLLGVSFGLTFAKCPSPEKVNEILKANGVKNVEVVKVNDYSEYELCGLDLKTEGRVIENALFITPDGKFLIPKIGKIIKIKSPLSGYYAVYVKTIDGKKSFIGYVNDKGIFIPDLVLLKQPQKENGNNGNATSTQQKTKQD